MTSFEIKSHKSNLFETFQFRIGSNLTSNCSKQHVTGGEFCKEANIFTSWGRKRIVFCPHCARGFNFMSINCTVRRILNVSRIRKKSKSQHETSSIYFNFATAGPAFSSSSLLLKQQTLKRESLVFILNFSPLPSSY